MAGRSDAGSFPAVRDAGADPSLRTGAPPPSASGALARLSARSSMRNRAPLPPQLEPNPGRSPGSRAAWTRSVVIVPRPQTLETGADPRWEVRVIRDSHDARPGRSGDGRARGTWLDPSEPALDTARSPGAHAPARRQLPVPPPPPVRRPSPMSATPRRRLTPFLLAIAVAAVGASPASGLDECRLIRMHDIQGVRLAFVSG